jgi:SAM-dependent methyltransferase
VEAADWDTRYAQHELVWGSDPNRWVVEQCADLPPGRALDLACGEGRNTIWLAGRGWAATGVDFSGVALARAAELADRAAPSGEVHWVQADLAGYLPEPQAYDLVLMAYLQLPAPERRRVVRAAAGALAPGGALLVIAHDSANLTDGVGGPQDPSVLYTVADLISDLRDRPDLTIVRAEPVLRPVSSGEVTRHAVDALLLVRRG